MQTQTINRRAAILSMASTALLPTTSIGQTCQTCGLLGDGGVVTRPSSPAVSDSQRPRRQNVRYINIISRYDGLHHTLPFYIDGEYVDDASPEINQAMCDWRTGQTIDMKRGLLNFIWRLHESLSTSEPFFLVSGYRSPQTNAMLAAQSSRVAQNSLHLHGEAADIRLTGKTANQIYRAAVSVQQGGIGLYTSSDFVHIDCGSSRTWGS